MDAAVLARLYTPLISDTMDRMGIAGRVLDRAIQPIFPDPALRAWGRAFPCRVVPTDQYVEIDTILAMVDAVPAESIVVVAADADIDAALWGGMMSTRAQARGARGAVVNGGARDVEQIAARAFPVFATHRCVKDIRTRGFMHSFDVPVTCGGVVIAPGDFIYADANGVVALPAGRTEEILAACAAALTEEDATMRGLATGQDARSLYNAYGRF